MKKIELNQGYVTLVDDEDYEFLSQFKWQIQPNRRTTYVIHSFRYEKGRKRKTIRMHRLIMRVLKGQVVDHIDGNGLNNQRSNLRICTSQENCQNQRKANNKVSKYKGVSLNKNQGRWFYWMSRIQVDGIPVFLGQFLSEIEAAKAYNEAAIKYFGEFAKLNIIDELNDTVFSSKTANYYKNKLSTGEIDTIKEMYGSKNYTQKQLGDLFGIGHQTVGIIVRKA